MKVKRTQVTDKAIESALSEREKYGGLGLGNWGPFTKRGNKNL